MVPERAVAARPASFQHIQVRAFGGKGVVATTPPESGAALAVALRADPRPTIADVGRLGPAPDALHGLVEVADAHVIVVRGCYLALRRAMRVELTSSAAGSPMEKK